MSNDTPDEYYDFVNTAYWRTCSLLMEETVRKGFPDRFIKWVASTRWSFCPNSAWDRIETTGRRIPLYSPIEP